MPKPQPTIETALGTEWRCAHCAHCGEYWPKDLEFFFADKRSGSVRQPCKACYYEQPSVRRKRDKAIQRQMTA